MKFMHNDNSKSMAAKSVLVKSDRVDAGMNLVNRALITTGRLSTGDWRDTQRSQLTEQTTAEGASRLVLKNQAYGKLSESCPPTLSYRPECYQTPENSRQENSPEFLLKHQGNFKAVSQGSKSSSISAVISHDGSAHLPVGKQRFLNGFQDEEFRSNRAKKFRSSTKNPIGISL